MLFNWANGPTVCFWYTEQVRGSFTYLESCSGGPRFQSEQGHDCSIVITTSPSPRIPMWYLKLLHAWYLTYSFDFNMQSHPKIWHYVAWFFFSHDSTAQVGLGLYIVEVSRSHRWHTRTHDDTHAHTMTHTHTRWHTRAHTRWHTHTRLHTHTHTVSRTPPDEWSARRKDLYLTTHNTHNRQTSMAPAGFELAVPASERPQTHA